MTVGWLDEMIPPGASGGEGSRLSKLLLSGEAIESGKWTVGSMLEIAITMSSVDDSVPKFSNKTSI